MTGTIFEKTLSNSAKYETIKTEWQTGTFSYKDEVDNIYHLMDLETYEDFGISAESIGEVGDWLTEGMEIHFELYGETVIQVKVKGDITMKVAEVTQAKDSGKDVTVMLANGVTMHVPAYIKEGDEIIVDKLNLDFKSRV